MRLLAGGSIGEAGYGPQVDTVVGRKAVGGRLSGLKPLDGLLQVESHRRKEEGGLLMAPRPGEERTGWASPPSPCGRPCRAGRPTKEAGARLPAVGLNVQPERSGG